MIPEAPLEPAGKGLAPKDEGWFVLNAREARWIDSEFGRFTSFEGEVRFPQLGINISLLQPGQPNCRYHAEDQQEDFLVVSGEALLLVEGEERRVQAWDLVHCPAWTEHVLVGAGDRPCTIVGVGARVTRDVVYPVAEVALRHGAGVEQETRSPKEAYAGTSGDEEVEFGEGWLPAG